MACSCPFQTEDEKAWLKCWRAVFITRDGLCDFVKNVISSIYSSAVSGLPIGSQCRVSGAGTSQHARCDKQFETVIQKYRNQWHTLNAKDKWKNSDQSKLCSSEWEFAKCFIHAQGYKTKTKIEETDLNGIISIIRNCSEFQNYFAFPLPDPSKPLEKVNGMF